MLLEHISEEFSGVKFGDRRLSTRFLKLMNSFASFFQRSIPDACGSGSDIKAAYRFFGNRKVNMHSIHQSHLETLYEKVRQFKVVLNIQDTTKLNYFSHKSKKDCGHIGTGFKTGCSLGYWMHTGIVRGYPCGDFKQRSVVSRPSKH